MSSNDTVHPLYPQRQTSGRVEKHSGSSSKQRLSFVMVIRTDMHAFIGIDTVSVGDGGVSGRKLRLTT